MRAAPPRKPAGVAGFPKPNTLRDMIGPNTFRTASRPAAPRKTTPARAPVAPIRLPSARTITLILFVLVGIAFLIQVLASHP
jgi:hypothetical protein